MTIIPNRRILHPGSQGAAAGVGGAVAGVPFTQLATLMTLADSDRFLRSNVDLTNNADTKTGTFFLSFSRATGVATHGFFGNDGERVQCQIGSGNDKFTLNMKNSSDAFIYRVTSATTFGVGDQDYHTILGSFDLTDSGERHFLVDGVDDSAVYATYTDDTIDYTDTTGWGVGATDDGGQTPWDGNLAVVWFDNTFIDLSVQANVDLFLNPNDGVKPVSLGYNGELPLGGTSPLLHFAGFPFRNLGRGGDFTESGTPIVSTVFPTD